MKCSEKGGGSWSAESRGAWKAAGPQREILKILDSPNDVVGILALAHDYPAADRIQWETTFLPNIAHSLMDEVLVRMDK